MLPHCSPAAADFIRNRLTRLPTHCLPPRISVYEHPIWTDNCERCFRKCPVSTEGVTAGGRVSWSRSSDVLDSHISSRWDSSGSIESCYKNRHSTYPNHHECEFRVLLTKLCFVAILNSWRCAYGAMCARHIGRYCTLLLAIVLRRGVHGQFLSSGKSPPLTIEECF